MKPTPSPHDETIIELLKRVGTLKAEYPPELLAARRAAFIAQIEQQEITGADEAFPSEKQVIELLQGLKLLASEYPSELLAARRAAFLAQIEEHNRVVELETSPARDPLFEVLETLKPVTAEYPPELLSARRGAFLAQIQAHNHAVVSEEAPSQDPVLELLENLKPVNVEYPSDLFAARRAAFIKQIEQRQSVKAREEGLPSPNGRVFTLLERLKSIEFEYPRKLWSARRSVFVGQIREGKTSILDALRTAVRNLFDRPGKTPSEPAMRFLRTSLVVAGMLLAAFVGSLVYGNRQPLTAFLPSFPEHEGSQSGPIAVAPTAVETAMVICKPGYLPPLCLAKEFDKSQDLTFPGNGSARPAVAKDTIPGYSRIHQPAYVNDGLYGSGASWISNSAYSWIKIDLGEVQTINTITFGRDRLGNFNDGDPGQFIIAVALSDNVYANGNSSNDSEEYTEVYNSADMGFDGAVSGAETIEASFEAIEARYVKITFENERTAVDEIEVFMILPPELASHSTQRPRDTLVPPSFTPIPTNTLVPSRTPTLIPTNTFVPTITATPRPTLTPVPTDTEVPTDTPEPPTDTPLPPPTDTPEPPTDTPLPPPTDTPELPTDTTEPQLLATDTPEVPGP